MLQRFRALTVGKESGKSRRKEPPVLTKFALLCVLSSTVLGVEPNPPTSYPLRDTSGQPAGFAGPIAISSGTPLQIWYTENVSSTFASTGQFGTLFPEALTDGSFDFQTFVPIWPTQTEDPPNCEFDVFGPGVSGPAQIGSGQSILRDYVSRQGPPAISTRKSVSASESGDVVLFNWAIEEPCPQWNAETSASPGTPVSLVDSAFRVEGFRLNAEPLTGDAPYPLQSNATSMLDVSGDGEWAAFDSSAPAMTSLTDTTSTTQIYAQPINSSYASVWPSRRVSRNPSTGQPANAGCAAPSVSYDGSRIAFESSATNLAGGDYSHLSSLDLYDPSANVFVAVGLGNAADWFSSLQVVRVSADSPKLADATEGQILAGGFGSQISYDGTRVAYVGSVVTADGVSTAIIVTTLSTDQQGVVSVADRRVVALVPGMRPTNMVEFPWAMSPDGTVIAYAPESVTDTLPNLVTYSAIVTARECAGNWFLRTVRAESSWQQTVTALDVGGNNSYVAYGTADSSSPFIVSIPPAADIAQDGIAGQSNGVVDFGDLLAFLNWSDTLDPNADLNHDGIVDFEDFLWFFAAYDSQC